MDAGHGSAGVIMLGCLVRAKQSEFSRWDLKRGGRWMLVPYTPPTSFDRQTASQNAFRCALGNVPSNNLGNLTTYTGGGGGVLDETAGGNPPLGGFYWQP